jgi:hypothetical protein
MKVGSKWQIFVPSELGYAGRQVGKIPPNSTLIFDIELLSIEKSPEPAKAQAESQKKPGPPSLKGSKEKSGKK